MIRKHLWFAVVLCLAASATAADAPKPSADETAIRKAIDSFTEAFNRGDAKAIAAHWSPQGSYVVPLTGERLEGRDAVEKFYTALFADDFRPQLSVTVDSLHMVGNDVAVEEGTAVVRPDDGPADTSTYIAIHVKKDGKWSLDSVRETMFPPEPPDDSSPLDVLEWMIGRWVDKSDTATVETVCQWTANKSFITRTFTAAVQDQPVMSGTQVIAWDPVQKRIRSWVFDSDGSFGEGYWTQQDDRWLIRASNTLADGKKATAVQIITKKDDDTITWQSIGRQVDGELLPNIDPITIVRKSVD